MTRYAATVGRTRYAGLAARSVEERETDAPRLAAVAPGLAGSLGPGEPAR